MVTSVSDDRLDVHSLDERGSQVRRRLLYEAVQDPTAPGREAAVRHDRSEPAVAVVTTARLSHTEDIALRQRRYILTQSARMVCILLAALLPVPLPYKGLFILGAVLLPWFGVVMANAGPTVARKKKTALRDGPVRQSAPYVALEPGRVIDAER
jgi:hypothetical protein